MRSQVDVQPWGPPIHEGLDIMAKVHSAPYR